MTEGFLRLTRKWPESVYAAVLDLLSGISLLLFPENAQADPHRTFGTVRRTVHDFAVQYHFGRTSAVKIHCRNCPEAFQILGKFF